MKTFIQRMVLDAAPQGLSFMFEGGFWRQGVPRLNRRPSIEEPCLFVEGSYAVV